MFRSVCFVRLFGHYVASASYRGCSSNLFLLDAFYLALPLFCLLAVSLCSPCGSVWACCGVDGAGMMLLSTGFAHG